LKTVQTHHRDVFSALSHFQRLATMFLLLLLTFSSSLSRIPTASTQSSLDLRFTGSLKFQEVSPGIEHGQVIAGFVSKDELTGPWFINVLRIDPNRARLRIVHALDEGLGLETVSSISTRYRAAAATNGGYFRTTGTYRGESTGLLLLDGKLMSEPYNDRAGIGLISAQTNMDVLFGHLKFAGEILVNRTKHTVQGLNRPITSDELIVFTPEFHRTTLTNPDGIEVVVRRNRVLSISDQKGSSEIPSDGFVISAVGKARQWVSENLRKGSKVAFSWSLRPVEPNLINAEKWRRAYSMVGGGPQLIKAGKVDITDKQEKMSPNFRTDRHPRTAIARLDSGRLLLVTVDGRQTGVSAGMSLDMLAELLMEFGTIEAINLDGGGSTTMVVQNKLVNRPSDQSGERPVSDAILVFSEPN
jgi:exopolysaccharide biosynthesis protein